MIHTTRCVAQALGLALLLLLSGCAGREVYVNPDKLDAATGKGIVSINATMQGVPYLELLGLTLRPPGGTASQDILIINWSSASEGYLSKYYLDVEKGGVGHAEMPAGDYVLRIFNMSAGRWGGGSKSLAPNALLNLPFKVTAGEVTHLGKLTIRAHADRKSVVNRYGGSTVTTSGNTVHFDVKTSESLAEDMDALKKLLPNVRPEQIKSRPLGP